MMKVGNIIRDKRYRWLLWPAAVIVTLIFYSLVPYESRFIEMAFSTGWFQVFRVIWDYTIGLSPVPLLYVLIIGLILYWYWGVKKTGGLQNKLVSFGKRVLISICFLFLAFYWLWGFNYKRVGLATKLSLEKQEVNVDRLFEEYQRVTDTLNSLAQEVDVDTDFQNLESQIRQDLISLYNELEISHKGRVRVRKLKPKGSLLHISTAGVYLPFVGEGHLDAGLHPITHPFTMMHEMSHGYGFTGEDICNFLALLGCIRSDSMSFRYSGYFGYWRYLRSNAYRADKERFKQVDDRISAKVREDYEEIIAYANRYPDIMPKLRDLIYDSYLKSHGIQDGLSNYSAIINLALAYKDRYGDLEEATSIQ